MALFWACAQTHPRQEDIALRNLKRQHFKAFFPFFLVQRKSRGVPYGRYWPKAAFPSYIFVRLDDELINWAPINYTLGIRRLLTHMDGNDEDAYRLPCRADFVDGLHRMRIMWTEEETAPELIPIGTMIKIMRGPFSERTALVQMSKEARVGVILEVFNRACQVEFDVGDVERVTSA